jgi:hypothetical protein
VKKISRTSGLIMDLMTRKNSDSGRSLISSALHYFWTNRVAIAAVAYFPNSKEQTLLKKMKAFSSVQAFSPHPLTLCLKVSDDEQNESCKLVASNY